MRRLRRSCLPALLLGLLFGFGTLLPEMGHADAHRHAAGHDAHDEIDHGSAPVHAHFGVQLTEAHGSGSHPHFESRSAPGAKLPIVFPGFVRSVPDLDLVPAASRPAPLIREPEALAGRSQGPPPPSRAPPLS